MSLLAVVTCAPIAKIFTSFIEESPDRPAVCRPVGGIIRVNYTTDDGQFRRFAHSKNGLRTVAEKGDVRAREIFNLSVSVFCSVYRIPFGLETVLYLFARTNQRNNRRPPISRSPSGRVSINEWTLRGITHLNDSVGLQNENYPGRNTIYK